MHTVGISAYVSFSDVCRSFGIGHVLHNHINFDGSVDVDRSYHVHLASCDDYEKTVAPTTWSVAQHYAHDLSQRRVKIAFFSMTCQGKPDVPTRHALARFTQSLGVSIKWLVILRSIHVSAPVNFAQVRTQATSGDDSSYPKNAGYLGRIGRFPSRYHNQR